MGVPLSQMWTVAEYVVRQKIKRNTRYPLVLMLEPLLKCNLACAGCGKIQHPAEILHRTLSPSQCFDAIDQCRAPIVSIAGGEPLLHDKIDEIVAGLVQRKKYIYLCTNALLLERELHRFTPSKYLSFSVHVDGPRQEHDKSVCREGVFDQAISAIHTAVKAGFRVTTNTTLFAGVDPERMRGLFDQLMQLGVEGMMISPGYQYEKAPDQDHFLRREQTQRLFRHLLRDAPRRWHFNQSPLFLEFLQGQLPLSCTPWGNPTYNVFGWQRPCYLLDEGHCESFAQLMDETNWSGYGRESGHAGCQNCMVHSGYEPSAVAATFGSLRGMLNTARLMLRGPGTRIVDSEMSPEPEEGEPSVARPLAPTDPVSEPADGSQLPILQ